MKINKYPAVNRFTILYGNAFLAAKPPKYNISRNNRARNNQVSNLVFSVLSILLKALRGPLPYPISSPQNYESV